MQCDQVRDSAEAYGLGALDAEEREAVDRHAEACSSCRQLLDEATVDAAALALTAPLHRAPPELRGRLLRQIGAESRTNLLPLPLQRFTGHAATQQSRVSWAGAAPPSTPFAYGRRWLQTVAASLAVVLLLGAALWIARLQMQMNRVQSRSQAMERGLADFEAQRAAVALLASVGTARLDMQTTDPSSGATGAVIWNREQRKCSVFAIGLPAPPPDQAYHVWLAGPNRSWDEGELMGGAQGTAEKTIDLSRYGGVSSYQLIVSIQPRVPGSGEWQPILRAYIGD